MSDELQFTCACGVCGGHIVFPAEYAGTAVTCPHCNEATMLPQLDQLVPAEPAAEGSPSPETEPAPAEAPRPEPERRAQARAAARAPVQPGGGKTSPAENKSSGAPKSAAAERPGKQSDGKSAPKGPAKKLADPYAEIQAEVERLAKQQRCRECGGKIDPGTKICPHCGAVLSGGMRFVRRFGGFIALGLVVFLLVTWPYQWPPFLAKRAIRPATVRIQAEVLKFAIEKAADNNLTFVKGVVTNHAPVQLFGVKVEIQFVDRNGGTLSTPAVDQIQILEPHKVWNFKALVLDPDAVNVRTNQISWTR